MISAFSKSNTILFTKLLKISVINFQGLQPPPCTIFHNHLPPCSTHSTVLHSPSCSLPPLHANLGLQFRIWIHSHALTALLCPLRCFLVSCPQVCFLQSPHTFFIKSFLAVFLTCLFSKIFESVVLKFILSFQSLTFILFVNP